MWDITIMGTDLYHLINWFFIYSFLGWLVESIYMSFCEKKLVNRGFITGPFCPIYGFGALTVFLILRNFSQNYIALYFLGTILATGIEFVTAKIMIKVFGNVWWDYTEKPFNYKGILCLESTIAWGFYTVFLFAFLQKFVMWITDSYSVGFGKLMAIVVSIYYLIDFTIHICIAKADKLPPRLIEWKDSVKCFVGR